MVGEVADRREEELAAHLCEDGDEAELEPEFEGEGPHILSWCARSRGNGLVAERGPYRFSPKYSPGVWKAESKNWLEKLISPKMARAISTILSCCRDARRRDASHGAERGSFETEETVQMTDYRVTKGEASEDQLTAAIEKFTARDSIERISGGGAGFDGGFAGDEGGEEGSWSFVCRAMGGAVLDSRHLQQAGEAARVGCVGGAER